MNTAIEIINKLTFELNKQTNMSGGLIQKIVTEATDQIFREQGIKLLIDFPPGTYTDFYDDKEFKIEDHEKIVGWKEMPIISKDKKELTDNEIEHLEKLIHKTAMTKIEP
jgi:hypothetical protein